MFLDVSILFKIGAMGMLLIVIEQVLKSNKKEDIAYLAYLAGVTIILISVIGMVVKLFDTVKTMFLL